MARTRRTLSPQRLNRVDVLIEDTGPRSNYFKISQFDGYFYGGRNAFLLAGSTVLRPRSKVLVEVINKNGSTVFCAPVSTFLEGNSKLYQVEIYKDTPIGPGKIIILGVADSFADGRPVPSDWVGKFNVRWVTDVTISPLVKNRTQIRFENSPQLFVEEKFYPAPSSSFFSQSINVPFDIEFEPKFFSVFQNGYLAKIKNSDQENRYFTKYLGGKFTGSIEFSDGLTTERAIIDLPISKIFNASLAEIDGRVITTDRGNIIKRAFISSSGEYISNINLERDKSITSSLFLNYNELAQEDTGSLVSFAKLRLVNLSTLSGEIDKVRFSYKASTDPGGFTFLGEVPTGVTELFADDIDNKIVETGRFNDIPDIETYWYSATMSLAGINLTGPPNYYLTSSIITESQFSDQCCGTLLDSINATPIIDGSWPTDENNIPLPYIIGSRDNNSVFLFPQSEYTFKFESIVEKVSGSIADPYSVTEPVTFTASTNTVNRTSHGYENGMIVRFYNIITTRGIVAGQPYYVVNKTDNTFQISLAEGGDIVNLTGDGSATLLPTVDADYSLEVYLVPVSGSTNRVLDRNRLGQFIGKLTPRSGFEVQNFELQEFNFTPAITEPGEYGIRFLIRGGFWNIANVSLKVAEEQFFSPDEIDALLPVLNYGNDIISFKAEFLDVDNNSVETVAISFPTFFTGSEISADGCNCEAGDGLLLDDSSFVLDTGSIHFTDGVKNKLDDDFVVSGSDIEVKTFLSLENVDNTADLDKPLSTAQKTYVDEVAQGIKARTSARVLVDFNLDATYDNGTDGSGSFLEANSNGSFPTIDDIDSTELNVVGTRILITAQSNLAHNGLYVLDTPGDSETPWKIRRCIECDSDEEIPGSFIFVKSGTLYTSTGWVLIVDDPASFTIGVDDINVIQFSGAGSFLAGDGLELNVNEFSLDTGSIHFINGIKDKMDTDDVISGSAQVNITETAGILGINKGGTGAASAENARINLGATTIGSNLFTLSNPGAIRFIRINEDNSISALNNNDFRTAIGAGTGNGTVTSVSSTSPVVSSGGAAPTISLSVAYGDTLNPYGSKSSNTFLAAPNGSSGTPTFRSIVPGDIPLLNQNTTGTAANVTGTVAVGNGGTGATSLTANKLLIGNGTSAVFTNNNLHWDNTNSRLGIGTASPSYTLDVSGVMRAERYRGINSLVLNSYTTVNPASNVYLYSPPNDRDAWIYLDSADTSSNWGMYHRQIDSTVSGLPANSIGFVGGGSSGLQSYISLANGNAYFAGNVGIGTTSPSYKLDIAGNSFNDSFRVYSNNNSGPAVTIQNNASGGKAWHLISNGSSNADGAGKLQCWNSTDSFTALTLGFNSSNTTNLYTPLYISGDVGIGTTTPSQKLHVVGQIVATNEITAFFSDERLKTKVGDVTGALDIVESLSAFRYKNNELANSFGFDGDNLQIGLSAQEVQKVIPEIVKLAPFDMKRDDNNNLVSKSGENYLTLDYAKLVPVLIAAIKELSSEIKTLKENQK